MQNTNFLNKIESALVLRITMAFVFFYFGFVQLSDASAWTSYLPSFIDMLPISATKFVLLNGWFEIIAATLLVL
ncbi:MAG: hypothetical protein RL687_166, partial [Candidatus Parcubacteria bacterium]